MTTKTKSKKEKHEAAVIDVKPRVGFLGVGWIGRHRMEAIINSGLIEPVCIADPINETALKAQELAPDSEICTSIEGLLEHDLDGIVIATPSALHAEQAIMALEKGISVFCQKPLGRTALETKQVINAAKQADKLLAVDLSYRFTEGMQDIKSMIRAGEIGKIFAANLQFHNSYGPDKQWFYDPLLSGGGCVIDLGIHLIDLALWTLHYPKVKNISGRLYSEGQRIRGREEKVEDYASVIMELEDDMLIDLSCSWRLSLGKEALIEASFYGLQGGLSLKNVNGSFFDFKTERYKHTHAQKLNEPPNDWNIKAAVNWAESISKGGRYDPEIETLIPVAETIDKIYEL